MSYDLHSYNRENHRLTLAVRHSTPGMEGTTIEAQIELHLCPAAVDADMRVSALGMDIRWVTASTVPAMGDELARVLERVAAGLREGPSGALALLVTP